MEPLGIECRSVWDEIPEPDCFEYVQYENDIGVFETIGVNGEVYIKIGPMTPDEAHDAVCDQLMEFLESIHLLKEEAAFQNNEVRYEKAFNMDHEIDEERIYVGCHIKFSNFITGIGFSCAKAWKLITMVVENMREGRPMVFEYTYGEKPRPKKFQGGDFAY